MWITRLLQKSKLWNSIICVGDGLWQFSFCSFRHNCLTILDTTYMEGDYIFHMKLNTQDMLLKISEYPTIWLQWHSILSLVRRSKLSSYIIYISKFYGHLPGRFRPFRANQWSSPALWKRMQSAKLPRNLYSRIHQIPIIFPVAIQISLPNNCQSTPPSAAIIGGVRVLLSNFSTSGPIQYQKAAATTAKAANSPSSAKAFTDVK